MSHVHSSDHYERRDLNLVRLPVGAAMLQPVEGQENVRKSTITSALLLSSEPASLGNDGRSSISIRVSLGTAVEGLRAGFNSSVEGNHADLVPRHAGAVILV